MVSTENQNPYELSNSNEVLKRISMERANEQIKTGLKLSEAIKLLEENEGAKLKPDESLSFQDDINFWEFDLKRTYSVKLPPPKSSQVTRAQVKTAILNQKHLMKFAYLDEAIDAVCKELGL